MYWLVSRDGHVAARWGSDTEIMSDHFRKQIERQLKGPENAQTREQRRKQREVSALCLFLLDHICTGTWLDPISRER